METRIKDCSLLWRLGEEAKYKKFKCYVLVENLSDNIFPICYQDHLDTDDL